jgi:hypothetical protein
MRWRRLRVLQTDVTVSRREHPFGLQRFGAGNVNDDVRLAWRRFKRNQALGRTPKLRPLPKSWQIPLAETEADARSQNGTAKT